MASDFIKLIWYLEMTQIVTVCRSYSTVVRFGPEGLYTLPKGSRAQVRNNLESGPNTGSRAAIEILINVKT